MYNKRIGNNMQTVGLLLAFWSCVGVWFYIMTHVKKNFTYKDIRMAWLSGYVYILIYTLVFDEKPGILMYNDGPDCPT